MEVYGQGLKAKGVGSRARGWRVVVREGTDGRRADEGCGEGYTETRRRPDL